ncbi:hypothetical protein [Sphingopyxis sp.]|uniref:hypothetical protein n=1 Tax=Sphingopyxis sp. TaxID=1908224 RepID=UPI0025E4C701|nr:hypothetical protein [Sphingopyxis sp.]MBK6413884.1 hypothetical protein [Sphingopyxis sp.]
MPRRPAALVLIAIGAGGAPCCSVGAGSTARAAEPLVTRRGEIRTFRLADGSTATLDTDSRVGSNFLTLSPGPSRQVAFACQWQRYGAPEAAAGTAAANARGLLDLDLGAAGEARSAARRGRRVSGGFLPAVAAVAPGARSRLASACLPGRSFRKPPPGQRR